MIQRNDLCWCGSGKKWKKCHFPTGPSLSTADPQLQAEEYYKKYKIILKTPEQIAGIEKACQLTAHILDELCKKAKEGVTTNQLNELAEQLHKEAGAIAAPLHYGEPPFPKSICTSLNEVICHGIPNDIPLKAGDILNIDVSCLLNGYYGDTSRMVMIGEVSAERRRVVEVSQECLYQAIEILKPGLPLYKIGDAIENYAATRGCSVVNQFVGHGVGVDFHEPPQIPHHRNHLKIPLAAGMTFTIEPMINAGVREAVIDPNNRWEARTRDGRASAQWEHTLLITDTGYRILTLPR